MQRKISDVFIVVALLVLTVPVSARAQQQADVTSCGCLAFYDAKGQPMQLAGLRRAPLLNGTSVSSCFGMRMHPVLGRYEFHWGVDVAAPFGTPIYASADGVILEAGNKGHLGNYVRVRHSNAVATGYAHASRFAAGIHPGVDVRRGQVIAYVGSTGLSTGPHLHFEVWVSGTRVKPVCACVSPAQKHRPLTVITDRHPPHGGGAIPRALVGSLSER